MSITTYEELIITPNANKIALFETQPSEIITNWVNHAGDIYYAVIGNIHVLSFEEDGTELTEVSTLAEVSAGEWFYDDSTGRIYIEVTDSGTPYQHDMVGNYKMYFCNGTGVIFNDRYYEPMLISIPKISQVKEDSYWGVTISSQGSVSIANDNGYFDTIYETYAWNNKPAKVLWGGEDLPYSEYKTMFNGIIFDKKYSTNMFEIACVDKKEQWDTNIPLNSYNQTDYPNLEDEDVGKAIPWTWGIVTNQPVICVTRVLGTATSLHTFKIADTSLGSIISIDQVRVKGVNVSHLSGSIVDASFKLATSTYSPGDEVTVDFHGYASGTIIENPVIITRKIGEQIGETYTSTIWNQTAMSAAVIEANEFPVGVSVFEFTKAIDVVSDLMKSCLGNFYNDNDGLYSVSIWSPDIEDDMSEVNEIDILEGSLKAVSKNDDIRKTISIGWMKNWANNSYAYTQNSNDVTERLYGITKSITIPTLLSTIAGVNIYLERVALLHKNATININFTTKLQLSLKNVGDRIIVSFKRLSTDDNVSWLDYKIMEIKGIDKNFINNTVKVLCDDLKGIGSEVGNWTSDTPEFPLSMGGGSATPWDASWSLEKKIYAKNFFGYWTDDDGFIDSTDPESWKASIWW